MRTGSPMLTSYRVLDITQFVAGPTCCRTLAEFGAEVIKVELAPEGDRTRGAGFKPLDPALADVTQSTYFFQQNHSKKSLALNLSLPRSRELLRAIVAKIDVLVEAFTPGVIARAGLGYEDLRKIHPGLIMCSISVAGQSGPLSGKPGYDYIGSAYAGVSDLVGEPGQPPAHQGTSIGDTLCGMTATAAILAALIHREHTGEGQYIDAALIDTYFHTHQNSVPRVALQNGQFVPKRSGRFHPEGGGGAYRYKDDQWIYLIAPDHSWPGLARALDAPQWLENPRFKTRRERRINGEALAAEIEERLNRFPSRQAAVDALEREHIPVAPILTLNEAMAHPHLRQRGTVRKVKDRYLGEFDIPGRPVKLSAWPLREEIKAPLLGEDNENVLKELLELPDDEISSLYQQGVLVRDPKLGPRK
ncbi:MAG TPA: CoA transferase [Candidatus Binataceae bacterium]|nr:CoA transferase [Candidatus Binataceae bacterium]